MHCIFTWKVFRLNDIRQNRQCNTRHFQLAKISLTVPCKSMRLSESTMYWIAGISRILDSIKSKCGDSATPLVAQWADTGLGTGSGVWRKWQNCPSSSPVWNLGFLNFDNFYNNITFSDLHNLNMLSLSEISSLTDCFKDLCEPNYSNFRWRQHD